MSSISRLASPSEPNGKTVIAASVAGNVHDIAVRALSDLFEVAGWRSVCLGADVPPSEVADAAGYFEADLVVLSAALSTQLETVEKSIQAVREHSSRDVKVMVGGIAFTGAPDLWRRLGADGYSASGADAVALGGELVGLG